MKNKQFKNGCTLKSILKTINFLFFQDEGWKLNRTNYYQEGWLATGNVRGIVGVTFTTSHCKKNVEYPPRTNYNLRGHRSEVGKICFQQNIDLCFLIAFLISCLLINCAFRSRLLNRIYYSNSASPKKKH